MKILIYSILCFVLFGGCAKTDDGVLSPARKLEGNWTTPNAVTFYYSSDGCGSFSRYSKFQLKVNCQISAISDSFINMTWTLVSMSAITTIGSNCGLPAPPLAFPMDFVGVISSSKIGISESQAGGNVLVGVLNYTTDIITGTITEKDCIAYCGGYSTDNNTFILTRVK